jgi:putative endonuclease
MQANSFTKKYNVDKLVYYETCGDVKEAIAREKQLKGGSRKKKIDLVESCNPEWKDLYEEI